MHSRGLGTEPSIWTTQMETASGTKLLKVAFKERLIPPDQATQSRSKKAAKKQKNALGKAFLQACLLPMESQRGTVPQKTM